MSCKPCEWIEKSELIYEDEQVVALMADKPANFGHVIVMPKQHFTILEQVPDKIISHIGVVANKISIALFESLNIQGTNILIHNGVVAHQQYPHFMVHIIPRLENDGIELAWKSRQLSEEEMSTIELELTEGVKTEKAVIKTETPSQDSLKQGKKETEKLKQSNQTNYLIRQLERIP
ncbi:HIT family protein [Candidatus Woesearchaeota archaeon]|nr:HIT family protein [Candidatus Woesearchaeota archaeon]